MPLQGSAEAEALYSTLAQSLTVAFLRLGGDLITSGRFTRALQHFKQGVHLFGSVQARAGTAACYCCLGAVFMRKAWPLDAAALDAMLERQASGRESIRHFDLALDVRFS